jgi:hypothetical protein
MPYRLKGKKGSSALPRLTALKTRSITYKQVKLDYKYMAAMEVV